MCKDIRVTKLVFCTRNVRNKIHEICLAVFRLYAVCNLMIFNTYLYTKLYVSQLMFNLYKRKGTVTVHIYRLFVGGFSFKEIILSLNFFLVHYFVKCCYFVKMYYEIWLINTKRHKIPA